MAKFVKPLTETRIKLLKPKQTPYSDGNNLYLHVYSANKKTFLFWYTDPISKKRLKRKIGEHPDLSNSAVKLCPSGRRYKAQANLAFVVVDVGEKSITI